ncbi:hypothetical protein [Acidihalobacter ferrooxydans]|uniref:PEBP family protein n=1 Tax=Acidihalobacter ferrooxydans TaxID=1765967 RepID=A0A1P8UEH8_9GAMM|nr:hypothetical protein [Acidihalobacter ferrooxydans]APZ42198.1 hypothetical protein BW247_03065 [Acidihalobacter ferrooxydans]
MSNRILGAAALTLALLGSGTANAANLKAHLDAPGWNGRVIPPGQQCHRFGGHGATPRIAVSDIPPGTQALVLAFSDQDYPPMNHGGHGVIAYILPPGTGTTALVPSVPGHTFDLPHGFFIVHPHANPKHDIAGAYMPPCSGGKRHMYSVTLEAVTLNAAGSPATVLGTTRLDLGRY